jgi:23S rRNA (pseudouridine1915-N3)-methyltransferase
MNVGLKVLTLVINRAFGFSNEVYSQIPNGLSLSKMTFSLQMVRHLLVEQLCRAFSIMNKEPYHHK